MKKLILAVLMVSATAGAMAQISIPLGNSGYYGRIDLGNLSAPPVIYQEPMFAQRPQNYQTLRPTYLRVPPGHAKKWSKHCAAYNACNRPVYFVQDSWYNDTYAPHYLKMRANKDDHKAAHKSADKARKEHAKEHGKNHGGHGKGHGKD
jgi:hypothetical protein